MSCSRCQKHSNVTSAGLISLLPSRWTSRCVQVCEVVCITKMKETTAWPAPLVSDGDIVQLVSIHYSIYPHRHPKRKV